MLRPLLIALTALCGASLWAPVAQGETLRRSWLPGDAHWVAHLDMEAVGRSVLGRSARAWGSEHSHLAERLAAFEERYRLDPFQDLYGLTLYGSSAAPGDAVLIAVASPRLDELLAKLRAHPKHSAEVDAELEVHTWAGDDLPTSDPPLAWFGQLLRAGDDVAPGRRDARVLVLADRQDLLRSAVALVSGAPDAPTTLAANESRLLDADPWPGTTLYLEAGRGLPELLGRLPNSRLVQQARRVRVMLGEHQDRAGMRVRISTGTRDNARDVADVLRGGLRLLRLMASTSELGPEIGRWIDNVRVEEKRADVHMSFQGNAIELAGELEAVLERLPASGLLSGDELPGALPTSGSPAVDPVTTSPGSRRSKNESP